MKKLKNLLAEATINKFIEHIKRKTKSGIETLHENGEKAWLGSVAAMGDFSTALSQTDFVSKLNTYSSDVSKAMDEGFKIGSEHLESGLSMTPNNHRILDGGHGFFESISKAQEVGEANGWSDLETFQVWIKSYFTDLSSNAGMPVLDSYTDDVYAFLRNIGFSDETARDVLTVNGQEAIECILGGSLSAVAIFFAWKKDDKDNFSRSLGAMGIASVVSLNPVVLAVVIAAAALGYTTLVCRKSAGKGMIVSSAAMITSALIPGPLLLGVIPAIAVAVLINKKMSKEFDPSAHLVQLYKNLRDREKRQKILDHSKQILEILSRAQANPESRVG